MGPVGKFHMSASVLPGDGEGIGESRKARAGGNR